MQPEMETDTVSIPVAPPVSRVQRAFEIATVSVVLGVSAFGLVGLTAAMLGHDRPVVVVPLGLVAWGGLLLLWRPAQPLARRYVSRPWLILAGLVLIGVVTVVNLRYQGQYVLTNRDPGIYSNGGAWIGRHGSLVVDSRQDVLTGFRGLQANALGQQSLAGNDTRLEIQGAHLFPVLLAMGYWVGGVHGLFAVPALIGALSLAVLLMVGLRFLPDWAALTVVAAVALNFGWIYTVRSVLSEPLMLTFAFAGLWFTIVALADRSPRRLAVAGLVVGVSLAARLDAGVAVILLLPAVAFLLGRTHRRAPGAGSAPWRSMAAYAGGWVIPGVLAWIDLNHFSPFYVFFHTSELSQLKAGLVLAVIMAVAALIVAVASVPASDESFLGRMRVIWARRGPATAAVGAALVVGVALLAWWVRPLIQTHTVVEPPSVKAAMEVIQKRENLPLNGNQTYDESSVSWLVWYTGALVVAGAVLGIALLVRRFIAGRLRDDLALLVAMIVPITVLYLYQPSIAPDQPWAIRRFVPVTIPGLLLLAAWWAVWLVQRSSLRSAAVRRVARRTAFVALGAVAVLPPLTVTWPLRTATWEAGGADGIQRVCDAIGPDGVALLSYESQVGSVFLPAVRGFCPVAAAGFIGPARPDWVDASTLAKDLAGRGRTLTILANSRRTVLTLAPTAVDVHLVTVLTTSEVVATVAEPPFTMSPLKYAVWVGRVPPAG